MDAEGATSQVTRVAHAPSSARWSPDGKWLSFAMLVPVEEPWKISMPSSPEGAKWTPEPRAISRLHYRQDRVGYMEQGFTQLFVVPGEGGTPRQLTHGEFNAGARQDQLGGNVGHDWTPDGKSIVYNVRERGVDNLWRQALDGSGRKQLTHFTSGRLYNFCYSPDGKTIAMSRGSRQSDVVLFTTAK